MDALRDLDKDTQKAQFSEYLATLESHLESANSFAEQADVEDPELEGLIDFMEDCREEFLALQSSVLAGDASPEAWESMTENWAYLGRALSRFGARNWVQMGPTPSWRLNQLLFFCDQEAKEPAQISPLAKVIKELCEKRQAKSETKALKEWAAVIERVLKVLSSPDFHLAPELLSSLHSKLEILAVEMDLRFFDTEVQSEQKWVQQLQSLVEAVSLGEVEARYLLRERDRAVQRLEPALTSSVDKSVAVDAMPDALLLAREHLLTLENHITVPNELEDWYFHLAELWQEIEDLDEQSKQLSGQACNVCGAILPQGSRRCEKCKTPVMSGRD